MTAKVVRYAERFIVRLARLLRRIDPKGLAEFRPATNCNGRR
jgi:hypothetical protein